MTLLNNKNLPHVITDLAYVMESDEPLRIRIYPPSSGVGMEKPAIDRRETPIFDCRPIADSLTLDEQGFEFHRHRTSFTDYKNSDRVRSDYYPDIVTFLKNATGASHVIAFDHNVRSQTLASQGIDFVREPVDGAHGDYTVNSGPRRIKDILAQHDAFHLEKNHIALINVWRPIIGPVQDHPLAVCDARSSRMTDFVDTKIEHFSESSSQTPDHIGQIYSLKYNPEHRWFYVSNMQPDEVLLLKCYDSLNDGRARFTGHTGFKNQNCPIDFTPRVSIEVRTLVIFS